ncbi:hypothetical protein [Paenibacillus soyae]|uniref:DUF3592 domain-containing protein n=1 Tax=Paenibacillus soyae TaxID=2969249 RepID=A0A9X2MX11_9BACL|nr:hypothetical protein [Paenibacillus soyae]MCR2805167.1 hypothetical protein [Paenibacillus soyae]
MRYGLRTMLLIVLLMGGMVSSVFADWAASFVVYNGGMYTVTEEELPSESIGDRIGQVTHYSDEEGTYSGNFSNRFPEGTPYYAIQDGLERDRIAVKTEDGTFVAAVYSGPYGASVSKWATAPIWIGVSAVVAGVAVAVWRLISARSGRKEGV